MSPNFQFSSVRLLIFTRVSAWENAAMESLLVTSMFCIKKQFKHLSLVIAARFYLLLPLLTYSLFLSFSSVPPTTAARSAHVMVKHFFSTETTQKGTQCWRDAFTQMISTQDDLNICDGVFRFLSRLALGILLMNAKISENHFAALAHLESRRTIVELLQNFFFTSSRTFIRSPTNDDENPG